MSVHIRSAQRLLSADLMRGRKSFFEPNKLRAAAHPPQHSHHTAATAQQQLTCNPGPLRGVHPARVEQHRYLCHERNHTRHLELKFQQRQADIISRAAQPPSSPPFTRFTPSALSALSALSAVAVVTDPAAAAVATTTTGGSMAEKEDYPVCEDAINRGYDLRIAPAVEDAVTMGFDRERATEVTKVGTRQYCPPRRPTHLKSSLLVCNGIL